MHRNCEGTEQLQYILEKGRIRIRMHKKTIAVLFGGNSSEYQVSLHSAGAVLENINLEKYHIIPIGITRKGEWYHYTGTIDRIIEDTWSEDVSQLIPIVISPSPSLGGIIELNPNQQRVIKLDLV